MAEPVLRPRFTGASSTALPVSLPAVPTAILSDTGVVLSAPVADLPVGEDRRATVLAPLPVLINIPNIKQTTPWSLLSQEYPRCPDEAFNDYLLRLILVSKIAKLYPTDPFGSSNKPNIELLSRVIRNYVKYGVQYSGSEDFLAMLNSIVQNINSGVIPNDPDVSLLLNSILDVTKYAGVKIDTNLIIQIPEKQIINVTTKNISSEKEIAALETSVSMQVSQPNVGPALAGTPGLAPSIVKPQATPLAPGIQFPSTNLRPSLSAAPSIVPSPGTLLPTPGTVSPPKMLPTPGTVPVPKMLPTPGTGQPTLLPTPGAVQTTMLPTPGTVSPPKMLPTPGTVQPTMLPTPGTVSPPKMLPTPGTGQPTMLSTPGAARPTMSPMPGTVSVPKMLPTPGNVQPTLLPTPGTVSPPKMLPSLSTQPIKPMAPMVTIQPITLKPMAPMVNVQPLPSNMAVQPTATPTLMLKPPATQPASVTIQPITLKPMAPTRTIAVQPQTQYTMTSPLQLAAKPVAPLAPPIQFTGYTMPVAPIQPMAPPLQFAGYGTPISQASIVQQVQPVAAKKGGRKKKAAAAAAVSVMPYTAPALSTAPPSYAPLMPTAAAAPTGLAQKLVLSPLLQQLAEIGKGESFREAEVEEGEEEHASSEDEPASGSASASESEEEEEEEEDD